MPRSRKERGHYGFAYRRIRSQVLAEEAICYLCGLDVDKGLYWMHPGAPQLHLLVPITRGGSWRDRANCRLTHRLCNIRQSNKLDGELLVQHQRPDERWIVAETP